MLRSVERYRATMLEAVPTGFMYMLADPAIEKYDLSSLERLTCGGQTFPAATAAEVEEKFGATLLELWGMDRAGRARHDPCLALRAAARLHRRRPALYRGADRRPR